MKTMTKNFFKLMVAIIIVPTFFVSCKFGGKGETKDSLGSTTTNNDYIAFYNAFIDVYKVKSDKYNDLYEWATEDYPKDKKAHIMSVPSFNGSSYDKNLKLLKDGLKADIKQKDEINKQVKIITDAMDVVSNNLEAFNLYKTAEDYKTDNWKKGDELVAGIVTALDQFFQAHDTITPTMTELADKAEMEFLAKDPEKDYIIAMKKSMKDVDAFYDALVLASNGKDKTKVEPAYATLEKSFETVKALDASKIKNASRKIYYENYIKWFEEMLAICRKANNNVKDGSADYNSLGRDIDSKYDLLVSTYNNFIN